MEKQTYRDVLSPKQSIEMGRFLYSLLWAADKAIEAGVKPNVNNFLHCWIGDPVSPEGKKERKLSQHREYNRKRRALRSAVS